jgi:glycerate kinase
VLTLKSASPLRVLVAPDSFKGSLTAAEAAAAIAAGLDDALGASARIRRLPIADGGEGTLDILIGAANAKEMTTIAKDALGRPRRCRFALLPGGAALIEASEANGLLHVEDQPLQPLAASSFGVGVLVRSALESGANEIVLTVGGSASTDGGAGLLRALGARFCDSLGVEIADGGGALASLATIDLSALMPRAHEVRWRVACDVDNPLTGRTGAAAVFGPQKGATDADVEALDSALRQLSTVLHDETGVDVRGFPGGGAAGGIPAALHAVFGAELSPGIDLVAEALDLAGAIADSDLVVTGEGSFDEQSLRGKAPAAIAALAMASGVPVVVIAGSVSLTPEQMAQTGIAVALPLADGVIALDDLLRRAPELLRSAATRLGALIKLEIDTAQRSARNADADDAESGPAPATPRTIKGEGS